MKKLLFIFLSVVFVFQSCSQKKDEKFELKPVQSDLLKKQFEDSDYQMNIILSYFKKNYTISGEKTEVKFDQEMGGNECGFTQKFKEGITYTYLNCGEAVPVEETIVIPNVELSQLKKWIEAINASYPMEIKNVWYQDKNEYGPEDKEAGCYYKILSSENNMTVEIWCGS